MVLERIASMALRIGELAFAAVVLGITSEYLHAVRNVGDWHKKRFIYTDVVACLSIILSLFWLLPFAGGFIHWPVDLILFILWIVAFGLLVAFIGPLNCGSVFHWGDITQSGGCQKWKADVAFAFLSAIFWLASALLGLYFVHKHRTRGAVADGGVGTNAGKNRRRWYRSNNRV